MSGRQKFSILQLILPRPMVEEIKAEAKRQGISVMTLVRHALEQYLGTHVSMKSGGRMIHLKLLKQHEDPPMTPEEIQYADEVMRIFREEDR